MPALISRPFDFRIGIGIPLVAMALLLLLDVSVLDFAIAHAFYSPESGFIGKHNYWLEEILHDKAKQVVILIGIITVVCFLLSLLPTRLHPWRRWFGYLVLTMALSTAITSPLKDLTAVHCPWSLRDFGGQEIYTSLLETRAPTLDPGRCWPGGHASAGFCLFSFYFALRDRRPRLGRIALAVALGVGCIFSLGRMLQGAHFLSHNLWTLLFDWMICVVGYRWILYRPSNTELATPDFSDSTLPKA